jgi:tetratricopeptide repeat protein
MITGGLPAHRSRSTRTSWQLCLFPVCAASLWLLAFSPTLQAQKSGPHPIGNQPTASGPTFGSGAITPGTETGPFDDLHGSPLMIPMPSPSSQLADSEGCNSWTESEVHSPTVSVARLAVPGKAGSEYQKGCGAYKDKHLEDAERHLRKAIEIYPSYPAAWVVLGQALDGLHKRDDARQACSQAVNIDPTYVAPYLCLAQFSATENDWKQVSSLAEHAMVLDPVRNPYVLYYMADAALHLNDLDKAETSAQTAVALDPWHHLPQLHLLLAQIYAAKGDPHAEAEQLRNYLKVAPNSGDAAGVRNTLAQLESQPGPVGDKPPSIRNPR